MVQSEQNPSATYSSRGPYDYRGKATIARVATPGRNTLRLALFLVFLVGAFAPNVTVSQVATGTYTGSGAVRSITGLGWQPDAVVIKSSSANATVVRTSSMVGDSSKQPGTATALLTNRVTSLDADGFSLGTHASVNATSTTYHWVAFKEVTGYMDVGSYTGDGNASKTIGTAGFQPDLVWLMPRAADSGTVRFRSMTASYRFSGGVSGASWITGMTSSGFTVGNTASTNTLGRTYHYMAWKADTGIMAVRTYTGNATDNRTISGVGFVPQYVIVMNGTTDGLTARTSNMSTDISLHFNSTAPAANGIQAMDASDGFQVGSSNAVNRNTTTHYYAAWANSAIFISAATGNWSTKTTWTRTHGTDADTIPDGTDSAFIQSAHTVTLTGNVSQLGTGVTGTLVAGTNTVGGYGRFALNSGGTFKTAHLSGVNGTLVSTGGLGLNSAANYEFNGTGAQVTGTTMPSTVRNLTINNSAGVSLSQSTIVNGTLGLPLGAFTLGATTLTINADITQTSGTLNGTGTTSNIIIGGTTVGSTLPAVTLNLLTMNRSAGISIGGTVQVQGTLDMQAGNIYTGSNVLEIGSSTTNLGSLSYTAGVVVGFCRRWFNNVTVSNVVFPVGLSGLYRPSNISFTGAPTTGGTLTTKFFGTDPTNAGLPLNDAGYMITRIFDDGFWTMTAGNGLAGGTYSLDLTAKFFYMVSDFSALHIVKRPSAPTDWSLNGTHATGTGDNQIPIAHRTGMTGFSDFGIGSGSDNPLPIELVSFNLKRHAVGVQLEWQTSSEIDNAGFEVQRMAPNESKWSTMASHLDNPMLAGLGTSAVGRGYRYLDVLPETIQPGLYSYRLIDIGTDGARIEHAPQTISIAAERHLLGITSRIVPNPSVGVANVVVRVDEPTTIRIELLGALGQRLSLVGDMSLAQGTHRIELPTSDLPNGRYFARIGFGDRVIISAFDHWR